MGIGYICHMSKIFFKVYVIYVFDIQNKSGSKLYIFSTDLSMYLFLLMLFWLIALK